MSVSVSVLQAVFTGLVTLLIVAMTIHILATYRRMARGYDLGREMVARAAGETEAVEGGDA